MVPFVVVVAVAVVPGPFSRSSLLLRLQIQM